MTPTTSREGHVEAEGRRVRYVEAGQGSTLVHLPGEGGLGLTPALERLARRRRVVAFDGAALAALAPDALARALAALAGGAVDLLATAGAAATALSVALHAPALVRALVLESPVLDADPGRLAGVTVPTLVVCGTRDEGVAPAAGRGCRASMPNCHLVFVYEAGPAVGAERPEAYAEVVADFLDRHEGFVVRRTPALIHP